MKYSNRRNFIKKATAAGLMSGFSGSLLAQSNFLSSKNQPPEPVLPIPSERQMNWQKQELLMFVHFGMKTFYPSGRHLGDGTEDPQRFNPKYLDANQWVEAAKAGGFKGIVLTAKHHDGFCNWPTLTTRHSVSSSPWKNGKGDVMKEVADACHKAGLFFGIYLSVYDRNYENSDRPKEAYAEVFEGQLTELLTDYGKVDELWFDGMGAENMIVNLGKCSKIIQKLMPEVVVYGSGHFVDHMPEGWCMRWPGNHGGIEEPNWSFRNLNQGWYPAEASLKLQGNWFYNGPMVSLDDIKDYYLRTVGRNSVANMNVAPNQFGLIDPSSIERLKEFRSWVESLDKNSLSGIESVKISADSWRGNSEKYSPDKAIDGNYDTYFTTDDHVTQVSLEIDLGKSRDIQGIILQEYIPLGQRVSAYTIECYTGSEWRQVFFGSTIGYKKLVDRGRRGFPKAEKVRLTIIDSRNSPLINTFSVIGNS